MRILTKDVPEVLILGNDEVAEGALEAIKELKFRIPKDVAVVVYRDIETLSTKYPTYTSLRMAAGYRMDDCHKASFGADLRWQERYDEGISANKAWLRCCCLMCCFHILQMYPCIMLLQVT